MTGGELEPEVPAVTLDDFASNGVATFTPAPTQETPE